MNQSCGHNQRKCDCGVCILCPADSRCKSAELHGKRQRKSVDLRKQPERVAKPDLMKDDIKQETLFAMKYTTEELENIKKAKTQQLATFAMPPRFATPMHVSSVPNKYEQEFVASFTAGVDDLFKKWTDSEESKTNLASFVKYQATSSTFQENAINQIATLVLSTHSQQVSNVYFGVLVSLCTFQLCREALLQCRERIQVEALCTGWGVEQSAAEEILRARCGITQYQYNMFREIVKKEEKGAMRWFEPSKRKLKTNREIIENAISFIAQQANYDINPSKLIKWDDNTLHPYLRSTVSDMVMYENFIKFRHSQGLRGLRATTFKQIVSLVARRDTAKTCVFQPLVDVLESFECVNDLVGRIVVSICDYEDEEIQGINNSLSVLRSVLLSNTKNAKAGLFWSHIMGVDGQCDGCRFHCASFILGAPCGSASHNIDGCSDCFDFNIAPSMLSSLVTKLCANAILKVDTTLKDLFENGLTIATWFKNNCKRYSSAIVRGKVQKHYLDAHFDEYLAKNPTGTSSHGLVIVDYMMGFLPRKYLEEQKYHFGKVGMGVLTAMYVKIENGEKRVSFTDFVLSSNSHSAQDFIALLPALKLEAERRGINVLTIQSDNASNFSSFELIPAIYFSNRTDRVTIQKIIHTESGLGKTPADGHMSFFKRVAFEYYMNGNNIENPAQLYLAAVGIIDLRD